MIFKLLSLSFLFVPFAFSSIKTSSEVNTNEAFILNNIEDNNYELIGVKDEYLSYEELRIYNDSNYTIVSIKDDAFLACSSLTSLMISYSVNSISSLPNTVNEIHYTGSKKMFNSIHFELGEDVLFFDYSYDEGFIYYWNTLIRPSQNSDICEIGNELYSDLLTRYNLLSDYDKSIVDEYEDIAGVKIVETMKFLKNYFMPTQPSNNTNYISQEKTMSIIVIITIIGMTTISIFYLLKKLNIIS